MGLKAKKVGNRWFSLFPKVQYLQNMVGQTIKFEPYQ